MPATKPAPTRRSTAKARTTLSSELILDTAMTLAIGSLQPLSLSQLGRALQADPTAVYRHFRSRDDLLRAMSERVHQEIDRGFEAIPDDVPWRAQVEKHAWTIRQCFMRYPALAREYAHRVTGGSNESAGARWLTERLIDRGLEPVDAVRTTRAIAELIFGSIAASTGVLAMPASQQREELARLAAVYRAILPPHVDLSVVVAESVEADLDETFRAAMDLMLDGLEAQLSARQKS